MANAANQSISFPLVEHSAKIEAARLLAYRALAANDAGRDAGTEAAMAKWFGISTGGTLNVMKLILVRQLIGAEFAGLRA